MEPPLENIPEFTFYTGKTTGISQVYSKGLEFALSTQDNIQVHPFVFCKDFLHDAIYCYLHHKKVSIYGISFEYEKLPTFDFSCTNILLRNKKDKDFVNGCMKSLDLLNQICKKLKILPSKLFSAGNNADENIVLIKGSKVWHNSPPLLSMYSLLIRLGFSHEIGKPFNETIEDLLSSKIKPYSEGDFNQLRLAKKGIDLILQYGYRKFFYIDAAKNYSINFDVSFLHNNCGIVGFSEEYPRKNCPYWYRKSIKNPKVVKND